MKTTNLFQYYIIKLKNMKAMQLAIYLAIRYNEPDIVNILIQTIDVNIPLETGTTLLEEAVRFRRPAVIGHCGHCGHVGHVGQDGVPSPPFPFVAK